MTLLALGSTARFRTSWTLLLLLLAFFHADAAVPFDLRSTTPKTATTRKNGAVFDSSVTSAEPFDPLGLIKPFLQPGGLLGPPKAPPGAMSDSPTVAARDAAVPGNTGAANYLNLVSGIMEPFLHPPSVRNGNEGPQSDSAFSATGGLPIPNLSSLNFPGVQGTDIQDKITDMAITGKFMMELLQEPGGLQELLNLLGDRESLQDIMGGMIGGGGGSGGGGGGKKPGNNNNKDRNENEGRRSSNENSDDEVINWGKTRGPSGTRTGSTRNSGSGSFGSSSWTTRTFSPRWVPSLSMITTMVTEAPDITTTTARNSWNSVEEQQTEEIGGRITNIDASIKSSGETSGIAS